MENFSADLVTLIRSASGLAKIVLVLLLGISVFSWGIIIEKAAAFYKSTKSYSPSSIGGPGICSSLQSNE